MPQIIKSKRSTGHIFKEETAFSVMLQSCSGKRLRALDDRERANLVRKAHRVSALSSGELHELRRIVRIGLQPFAGDVRRLCERAHSDDDAVLLKAALQGESSLNKNERFRLDEAISKRGKRIPG